MNRILGFFAASSVLLSACGGGSVQSPGFDASLQGIQIVLNSANSDQSITVPPGGSVQLSALGLFSTPPGTRIDNVRFFPCPDTAVNSPACTRAPIDGVSWSIDTITSPQGPVATVNNTGLINGLRRGVATVRARAEGFETSSQATVDGLVLQSISITAVDARNDPTKTVPLGRTLTLSAVVRCSRGFAGSTTNPPQSNQDCESGKIYSLNWSKPTASLSGDYDFVTQPAVGETVVIDTTRMGTFAVMASFVNEEGQTITDIDSDFSATARVLDDITLVADPLVAEPVPVLKGTRTRITALGVFSDGNTGDITTLDLGNNPSRNGQRLFNWTVDSSSIGGPLVIEEPGDTVDAATGARTRCSADCPLNNSIIVTAANNALVGSTGVTATGINAETTVPPASGTGPRGGLQVDDRIAAVVQELGLIRLSRICLAEDTGSNCSSGIQVPVGDVFGFKARGVFQGDPDGVERDIDPALIPIRFNVVADTAPNLTQPADIDSDGTPDDNGVRGAVEGIDTLRVSLGNGVAPDVIGNNREASISVTAIDQLCTDQFLLSNNTTASTENDVIDSQGEATNAGNVIDDNASSFGTFSIGSSLTGGTIGMVFRRDATVVTPPAAGAVTLGIQMGHPADPDFLIENLISIQTLNAAGAVVQTFDNISPSQPSKTQPNLGAGNTLFHYTVAATQPFSGVRVEVDVPSALSLDLTNLGAALGALLGLGGSTDVRVFAACAAVKTAN